MRTRLNQTNGTSLTDIKLIDVLQLFHPVAYQREKILSASSSREQIAECVEGRRLHIINRKRTIKKHQKLDSNTLTIVMMLESQLGNYQNRGKVP